ncbi:uncharacterized protein LOC143045197 isoform X2 [Mytilus galloprovincialis]
MFVLCIAQGVEGVAYDGTCKIAEDCTEANNVCTTSKCACSPTSYKTDGTNKCVKQIALGGTCTATPTGQCADANADCDAKDSICVCKANYFANKKSVCASKVTALDATCVATEPAIDQCAVTDSECINDDAGPKCLCKTSHYKDGTGCVIRIFPGVNCAANQCVNHASCNTTAKCQCKAGYTATPTTKPTMCSGVNKIAMMSSMLAVPIFVSMMLLLR